MWVRGLKLYSLRDRVRRKNVAPCVGAWIETNRYVQQASDVNVAPCVGAWIETDNAVKSLSIISVAPCVGAWIETKISLPDTQIILCRTLCGCVD